MGGNISSQVIEEIRNRIEIVELISRYLPLKARGKNYYGLCPFHTEKTPSFTVNPEKQIFHCFGCGAGGDIFGFLMKKENLSFAEAVRFLANQCGITVTGESPEGLKRIENRQKLIQINEMACEFYQRQLVESKEGTKAVEYLLKRGITLETQKKFKLGYAPSGWNNLLNYLSKLAVNQKFANIAGLIVEKENSSGYYDRFRERVIFPIYDYRQRLIGFGGRCLDEEKNPPKYLNSPETPVYHKGEEFYGLNWAKEAIRQDGYVIIVEGNLDFISLQQAGFNNVVASLGTAFTQAHVRLISHYTSEVVLFFDSDLAGQKAAVRSFPLFLGSKLKVRVAQVPSGKDPDSFVRTNGAEALAGQIKKAVPLLDFMLDDAVRGVNLTSIEGQIEAVNRALPILSQIPQTLERSAYTTKIAQRFNIKENLLRKELEKAVAKKRLSLEVDKTKLKNMTPSADILAQKHLLNLMLTDAKFFRQGLEKLEIEDFTDNDFGAVFEALKQRGEYKNIGISSLLHEMDSESAKNFVTEAQIGKPLEFPDQIFTDCLRILEDQRVKRQMRAIREKALTDKDTLIRFRDLKKQVLK